MTPSVCQGGKGLDDHSYSEAYRLECEATWALSLTRRDRLRYLGMIKNLDRLAELKAEMLRQWRQNTNPKKRGK